MSRKEKHLPRRIAVALIGNYILSLGISTLYASNLGTDPFTCMNMGIASHLTISFGTFQLLVNIGLFLIILPCDRRSFGIGALINMATLGYMIEFNVWWMDGLGFSAEKLAGLMMIRIICLFVAVSASACGCGIYMASDLGAAPWDRLGQSIEMLSKGRLKYRYIRIVYDCAAIAIGFFTGATVGVATFLLGFFAGPLVSFFKEHLGRRLAGT